MCEDKQNSNKYKLSFSFFRDVIILAFIAGITFKLCITEFKINLEGLSYTELLALLVAFFSVGLSVAFYFKASDTSNRFYDNSYKFTKDISSLLGRIEERFGEKLDNIKEGYTTFREDFSRLLASKEQNDKEKAEQIQKKDDAFNELDKLIGNLTEENIQDKNELQEKYNEIKDKLETAQNKIIELETSGAILETPFFELLGLLEGLKGLNNFINIPYETILLENMNAVSKDLNNRLIEAGYFNEKSMPTNKLINSLEVANFIKNIDKVNGRLRNEKMTALRREFMNRKFHDD